MHCHLIKKSQNALRIEEEKQCEIYIINLNHYQSYGGMIKQGDIEFQSRIKIGIYKSFIHRGKNKYRIDKFLFKILSPQCSESDFPNVNHSNRENAASYILPIPQPVRPYLLNCPWNDDAILHTADKKQSVKEIIDKLDFSKINNFCSMRDNIKRLKRQATNRRKIICKRTDKGLLCNVYQELLQFNN